MYINLPASHNLAEWQGLKFSLANGAPATMEATRAVEKNIARRQKEKWTFDGNVIGTFKCKEIDPRPAYFRRLRQLVDFDAIKKAKMKIAVELMYGAGRGYLDILLEEAGAKVTRFHPHPNPLFGGQPPEPSAEGMTEAAACVKSGQAQLALGLDGDADRFGLHTDLSDTVVHVHVRVDEPWCDDFPGRVHDPQSLLGGDPISDSRDDPPGYPDITRGVESRGRIDHMPTRYHQVEGPAWQLSSHVPF